MGRSERFYHPELDALRFFAFVLVFLCHAMPSKYVLASFGITGPVTELTRS